MAILSTQFSSLELEQTEFAQAISEFDVGMSLERNNNDLNNKLN